MYIIKACFTLNRQRTSYVFGLSLCFSKPLVFFNEVKGVVKLDKDDVNSGAGVNEDNEISIAYFNK